MGRSAHQPDPTSRRQVEAMAGYGVPEADIARVIAIDAKTLRKHYRVELGTGSIKARAKVAEFLYRKATTERAAMRHGRDLLAKNEGRLEGDFGSGDHRPTAAADHQLEGSG